MPMLSVTSPFTALLVVLAASAATPSLAADASTAFVVNEAASANAGTRKIELDYLASPGWGWSMTEIMSLKPVLVRFQDEVDFTPAYDIVDGTGEPLKCRLPTSGDDFFVDVENDDCKKHCMNHGRYCDHSLLGDDGDDGNDQIKQARKQFFAKHNVQGHQLVEESVRRLCVWKLYGKEDHQLFFDYHQAMQDSGCDAQLTHDCVQASLPASMDYTKLYECVQGENGLDPLLDEPHAMLEEELQHSSGDWKFSAGRVALFGEGHEAEHVTEFSVDQVFGNICFAFKNDLQVEEPLVCDFCQHYCPQYKHTNKGVSFIGNDQHCSWSLECDDAKTFDDYLASKNTTADAVIAAAAEQKAQNKNNPKFAGNVRPTNSNNKTVVETAGGMAATLLAMLLVGGLLMMAIMAIRVWRTKVIIERYVREQEELSMARARNDHGGEYGDHNHHDEAFFPDGNELDLDLEPALQYRDHIATPGASSTGPSSATFLPKLT